MRRAAPLALALCLAACGPAEQAPTDPAAPGPSGAGPEQTQPPAPAVAAMDPAKLANPCLLDPGAVGAALGFAVEKTEPETMGAMSGCTYRGKDVSLRLNFIVHDPVYFAQATEMTRKTRPGDKRDLAGDPDKAWVQQDGAGTPILHYYRQNVEVELAPLVVGGGDARAIEAALLKLPRVP
jgi:hypothetical protein